MEEMLWIEDIVESPSALPFRTNYKVDMVGFVYPHKVVARSAISTFWNAWNGVELEDGIKNERLKCEFSKVEENLDL